jgi:hypothetical protein
MSEILAGGWGWGATPATIADCGLRIGDRGRLARIGRRPADRFPRPGLLPNPKFCFSRPGFVSLCQGIVKDGDPHERPVFIGLSRMSRMSTFLAGGGAGSFADQVEVVGLEG